MDVDLWPQPSPRGMSRFSPQVDFFSGINIWFPLNCPNLNRSPRPAKSLNGPCHHLLFFSCLDIVINSWMIAHCKFLMRDFEIRKGGKQLQFMAWSYSISRDPPVKPALNVHQLLHITSSLGDGSPEHQSHFYFPAPHHSLHKNSTILLKSRENDVEIIC